MMNQTKLRVLTVGGGSGGHVTPVLAVINELAKTHPVLEVRFWCDRGYQKQARQILKHATVEVNIKTILSGKLRRYHNLSLVRQLLDVVTLFKNVIDIFLVFMGFFQSLINLIRWRPNVVFCKGGFVCLPVGYAASLLKIPLVIHDSDAHPGLTNRLLAKRAAAIATGAPLEYYNYPSDKAYYVGIPIKEEFHTLSPEEKTRTKELFHLPSNKPLVVVTGGGLGAMRINNCLVAIGPKLIEEASVVHLSGQLQYEELKQKVPTNETYKLFSFLSDHIPRLLGAADVVVSRAGATTMLELAAVSAPTIIVPNGQLVGGHQLKNAKVYTDAGAAVVVDETMFEKQPEILLDEITKLLHNEELRNAIGAKLHLFAKPDAAKQVVRLIDQAAGVIHSDTV